MPWRISRRENVQIIVLSQELTLHIGFIKALSNSEQGTVILFSYVGEINFNRFCRDSDSRDKKKTKAKAQTINVFL